MEDIQEEIRILKNNGEKSVAHLLKKWDSPKELSTYAYKEYYLDLFEFNNFLAFLYINFWDLYSEIFNLTFRDSNVRDFNQLKRALIEIPVLLFYNIENKKDFSYINYLLIYLLIREDKDRRKKLYKIYKDYIEKQFPEKEIVTLRDFSISRLHNRMHFSLKFRENLKNLKSIPEINNFSISETGSFYSEIDYMWRRSSAFVHGNPLFIQSLIVRGKSSNYQKTDDFRNSIRVLIFCGYAVLNYITDKFLDEYDYFEVNIDENKLVDIYNRLKIG